MDFWLTVVAGTLGGVGTFFILYVLRPIMGMAKRGEPEPDGGQQGLLESIGLPRDFVTALVAVLFGSFVALVFLNRIDPFALFLMAVIIIPAYVTSRLRGNG